MTMAENHITIHLRARTRMVMPVAWALYPLVYLRIMSAERAVAIAMRFARVEASMEGWGGD
ncbi:hypothetical protein WBP07_17970 [Novosphingobium sp. BL-8A]|uniref:hypothetical protein n=1 Tax=Novosphingobium sp. BL-8A TaxID=3127639 RepID=UPI00375714DC